MALVKKKGGTWQFCVDYQRLNAVTWKDSYPLPHIDNALDYIAGQSGSARWTYRAATGRWSWHKQQNPRQLSSLARDFGSSG